MATYHKVSRSIPSVERHTVITDVEDGDQLDITDILGRRAQNIRITSDINTVVSMRINNRIRIPKIEAGLEPLSRDIPGESAVVVSAGAQHPIYTVDTSVSDTLLDGLHISYIDIVSVYPVAEVSIEVW